MKKMIGNDLNEKNPRDLYAQDDFGLDLKETVYALDSTTIDLCLSVFPWARFRKTKGAVKLHTLLDLRGNIPTFIRISNGKMHDVNIQDLREVAWRVSTNIDAERDIIFAEGPVDALDHAADQFAYGSKMGIDTTRKWREEGFTREWPEVLHMSPEVKKRVDEMWGKLFNLGGDRHPVDGQS